MLKGFFREEKQKILKEEVTPVIDRGVINLKNNVKG